MAINLRSYYMLLGAGPISVVNHECLPYTRQLPLECDIDLTTPLTRLAFDAVDTNLCEEMT